MNKTQTRGAWLILFSLIIAIFLTIVPMPYVANLFRPAWILMMLFFWNIAAPGRVAFGTAFLCGILLDAINGNIIGEHALALVVACLIPLKLYKQLRLFPVVQQAMVLAVVVLIYEGTILMLHGLLGENLSFRIFWYPAMSSMLVWPVMYFIMRRLFQRFRVTA